MCWAEVWRGAWRRGSARQTGLFAPSDGWDGCVRGTRVVRTRRGSAAKQGFAPRRRGGLRSAAPATSVACGGAAGARARRSARGGELVARPARTVASPMRASVAARPRLRVPLSGRRRKLQCSAGTRRWLTRAWTWHATPPARAAASRHRRRGRRAPHERAARPPHGRSPVWRADPRRHTRTTTVGTSDRPTRAGPASHPSEGANSPVWRADPRRRAPRQTLPPSTLDGATLLGRSFLMLRARATRTGLTTLWAQTSRSRRVLFPNRNSCASRRSFSRIRNSFPFPTGPFPKFVTRSLPDGSCHK